MKQEEFKTGDYVAVRVPSYELRVGDRLEVIQASGDYHTIVLELRTGEKHRILTLDLEPWHKAL